MTTTEEQVYSAGTATETGAPETTTLNNSRGKWIGATVAIFFLVGIIGWYIHSRGYEETEDAQVNGHLNTVAARVDGTVTGVFIEDNHFVKAGDPLVELDPADYKVALDQSQAQLLQAQAQLNAASPNLPITRASNFADITSSRADVANAQAAVAGAESDLANAEARLEQSQANNVRAQADVRRYKQLIDKEEVSAAQYDQYVAAAKAQQATVAADTAAVASSRELVSQRKAALEQQQARLIQTNTNAPREVLIRTANIETQQAGLSAAKASVERNQLNLGYTHIIAPVSGVVMQRSAEVGNRVSAGEQLMQVVQIDGLWIDANFKETQLKKMRVGQPVKVKIDALGEEFEGTVEAMPAATGDRASLFPAENATGNYVKVVQRLPVRIHLTAGQLDLNKLRPGMSAEPVVRLD
jgi:membrane fusion protein, multidrug efflux system